MTEGEGVLPTDLRITVHRRPSSAADYTTMRRQ